MPQNKKKQVIEVVPYVKLAEIYDRVMDHVDYKFWNKYILTLFKYADTRVHSILDLSCGTGSMLSKFNSSNWQLYGADLSLNMLQQAAKKKELQSTGLFLTDASSIPVKNASFQAVLFLYDSFNYVTDKMKAQQMLIEVQRILVPGGLFIFDTVTRYQCRKYFKNYYENEFWGTTGYYRHSYFNALQSEQRNDFDIHCDNKIYAEHHRQYIYESAEIQKMVELAGFELTASLQNFTQQPAGRRAERVHYICKNRIAND